MQIGTGESSRKARPNKPDGRDLDDGAVAVCASREMLNRNEMMSRTTNERGQVQFRWLSEKEKRSRTFSQDDEANQAIVPRVHASTSDI
jgi:hypothetical protein